jgi:hypothetical protein
VAGGQFDALRAIGIFDDEFPPSYSSGLVKNNGGDIGANALRTAGDLTDGVIDVSAERLAPMALNSGGKTCKGSAAEMRQGTLAAPSTKSRSSRAAGELSGNWTLSLARAD